MTADDRPIVLHDPMDRRWELVNVATAMLDDRSPAHVAGDPSFPTTLLLSKSHRRLRLPRVPGLPFSTERDPDAMLRRVVALGRTEPLASDDDETRISYEAISFLLSFVEHGGRELWTGYDPFGSEDGPSIRFVGSFGQAAPDVDVEGMAEARKAAARLFPPVLSLQRDGDGLALEALQGRPWTTARAMPAVDAMRLARQAA